MNDLIENGLSDLDMNFTKTEKIIAGFIQTEGLALAGMTLSDLSEYLGVGEASIIRFSKKIGFTGFSDMKLGLLTHTDNGKDYNVFNFVDNLGANTFKHLELTKNNFDQDTFNKSITLLNESGFVYFFGIGTSGLIAKIAESKFMRMGFKCKSMVDPHFQNMEAINMSEQDVLVAISITGMSEDIIQSTRLAKEAGAKVISITNSIHSPLADLSDCIIRTYGYESQFGGGSFTGIMTQLFALDILSAGVVNLDPEFRVAKMKKTADAIEGKKTKDVSK